MRRFFCLAVWLAPALSPAIASARGLLWNAEDLPVWRDRAANGPYKVAGDAFDPLVPGEWNRIAESAAAFRENPAADRKTDYVLATEPGGGATLYVKNHVRMLDAAFYALVTGDDALKRMVKDELVWHSRQPGLRIDPEQYQKIDYGNWWMPAWLLRLTMCADFVEETFSEEELADFRAWLADWAYSYEGSVHKELSSGLFGNRYERDYANNLGFAGKEPRYNTHAYMDAAGVKRNQVASAHRRYNNRKAMPMQFVGLAGVWLDDPVLMDRAKLYFEEWLRFSVFPDGSAGEYERNALNRSIQQGVNYNSINIAAAVSVADALARAGDPSLYEFTTRDGIFGTGSGPDEPAKSLRLVAETHLAILEGRKDWYFVGGDVAEAYRLDAVPDVGGNAGIQWISDLYFAPIGNRYWKDADIRRSYTRRSAEAVPYSEPIGNAGPYAEPWRGQQAMFPSVLFMFAETEGTATGYDGAGGVFDGTDGGAADDTTSTPGGETDGSTSDGGGTADGGRTDDDAGSGASGATGGEDGGATPHPYVIVAAEGWNWDNHEPLDGMVLEAPRYVYVRPETGIASVAFHNNTGGGDTAVNVEKYAPYDYIAEKETFGPSDVVGGAMTVVAEVTTDSGEVHRLEAEVRAADATSDPAPAPTDTDALPDDWETEHFGGIDAERGGADDDFDGDGETNREEWVAGTDPTDPEDFLEPRPVRGVRWSSQPDRSYVVEYSDDNWNTVHRSSALRGTGDPMHWVDSGAESVVRDRQYRILVVTE